MFEGTRVRRRWRKLYRSAVKSGLTDLGVRLRNQVARDLAPDETIVEDEPVLVGDAQGLLAEDGTGRGRWGWMVITSSRAIWAALPDKEKSESKLRDLDLVFSEEEFDTFRWNREEEKWGRTKSSTVSVTLGFLKKIDIRNMLHESVNDARHDNASAEEWGTGIVTVDIHDIETRLRPTAESASWT